MLDVTLNRLVLSCRARAAGDPLGCVTLISLGAVRPPVGWGIKLSVYHIHFALLLGKKQPEEGGLRESA